MSFLELNLNEAKQFDTLPEGEYEVEVTDVERGTNKESGKSYVKMTLEPVGYDNVWDINYFLNIPHSSDKDKTKAVKLNRIKEAVEHFSVEYSEDGFNIEDFQGKRAYVRLTESGDPSDRYGVQNEVVGFAKRR